MEVRVAKELLHIQHRLEVAGSVVARGKDAYGADEIAQEAGDSLMIKIGEASDGGHGEKKQRVIVKLGAFFERFFGLSAGSSEDS